MAATTFKHSEMKISYFSRICYHITFWEEEEAITVTGCEGP
jgi:hypothetical protein